MFRLQEMVPEVYVEQSRDFQLFCRLYDVVFNSLKYNIDSISRSSPETCDSSVLELMKRKVGFNHDINISDNDLRRIISAFPHIIRNKGSMQGVKESLYLYSRVSGIPIDNIHLRNLSGKNIVEITSEVPLPKLDILTSLLSDILPGGYQVSYHIVSVISPADILELTSKVHYYYTGADKAIRLTRIVLSSEFESPADVADSLPVIVNVAQIADNVDNSITIAEYEVPPEKTQGDSNV